MKKSYFLYFFSLFVVAGCGSKNEDNVDPFQSCSISDYDIAIVHLPSNDTTRGNGVFSYDQSGRVTKIALSYEGGYSETEYYEYNSQGQLIKHVTDLSGGEPDESDDIYSFKYGNDGKLIASIYTNGDHNTVDSTVVEYISSIMIKSTKYHLVKVGTNDTITTIYDLDNSGNTIKESDNQPRVIGTKVKREYEYYNQVIPNSFKIDPVLLPNVNKSLLKKEVEYGYDYNMGVVTLKITSATLHNYSFDDKGQVIEWVQDIESLDGDEKRIFKFHYKCK